MARATYFCVDIECSGPVPALYDMLSLGCVPVKHVDGEYVIDDDRFYVEIMPMAPRVDEGAMKVNGLDLDDLKKNGRLLRDALDELTAFVKKHAGDTTPVFVGHNAPFDWSFVAYAFAAAGKKNVFGYKALDTKALSSGVLGLHWLDSNKEELAERLTLPDVESEKVHRADYDAFYQAHILVELLRRMPIAE